MTCFFADEECRGRLEWHHVLPKQRLKQEFRYGAVNRNGYTWYPRRRAENTPPDQSVLLLTDILGDERNRVFICSFHHERLTNARLHIDRDDLPESVEEFAKDYGLEGWLDRYTEAA